MITLEAHTTIAYNTSADEISYISGLTADETHYDDRDQSIHHSNSYRYNHRNNALNCREYLLEEEKDMDMNHEPLTSIPTSKQQLDERRHPHDNDHYHRSLSRTNPHPYHLHTVQSCYQLNTRPVSAPVVPFTKSKTYSSSAHATLRERLISNKQLSPPRPSFLQAFSMNNIDAFNNRQPFNGSSGGSGSISAGRTEQVTSPDASEDNVNLSFSLRTATTPSTMTGDIGGYYEHNKLLGTRQRRSIQSPTRSNAGGDDYDVEQSSLQNGSEDDPSFKSDDSTLVSCGKRSKKLVKTEIKFIMTKFIPGGVRKWKKVDVDLQRSAGYLI